MTNKDKQPKKRGPGKPKTIISPANMAKAEKYALEGCKNCTISVLMGWDPEWLHQRKDILKKLTKKRAERKLMLLRAQTRKALEGNDTTMQIWLGKNELEQTDRTDTKLTVEVPGVVVIGSNGTDNDKNTLHGPAVRSVSGTEEG